MDGPHRINGEVKTQSSEDLSRTYIFSNRYGNGHEAFKSGSSEARGRRTKHGWSPIAAFEIKWRMVRGRWTLQRLQLTTRPFRRSSVSVFIRRCRVFGWSMNHFSPMWGQSLKRQFPVLYYDGNNYKLPLQLFLQTHVFDRSPPWQTLDWRVETLGHELGFLCCINLSHRSIKLLASFDCIGNYLSIKQEISICVHGWGFVSVWIVHRRQTGKTETRCLTEFPLKT